MRHGGSHYQRRPIHADHIAHDTPMQSLFIAGNRVIPAANSAEAYRICRSGTAVDALAADVLDFLRCSSSRLFPQRFAPCAASVNQQAQRISTLLPSPWTQAISARNSSPFYGAPRYRGGSHGPHPEPRDSRRSIRGAWSGSGGDQQLEVLTDHLLRAYPNVSSASLLQTIPLRR